LAIFPGGRFGCRHRLFDAVRNRSTSPDYLPTKPTRFLINNHPLSKSNPQRSFVYTPARPIRELSGRQEIIPFIAVSRLLVSQIFHEIST
jgi:hypothetical protein